MSNSRLGRGIKNVTYGIVSQIIAVILNLLIPRLFILHFGSDVNGLLSFVSQIFGYFGLIEAGLATSTLTALYGPIAENDRLHISSILSASRIYFRRVALYYLIGTVIFAVVYSIFGTVSLSPTTVLLVILLQGLAGVVNYLYQAAFRQFLMADGRAYVLSNIGLLTTIGVNAAKLVAIYSGIGIVAIQLISLLVVCIQVPIYYVYMKLNYPWIKFSLKPDFSSLKQRSWILIHQVSSIILSGTDIVIVSLFCGLSVTSIYSVYNLVITGVNLLISTINSSLIFILGQKYHTDQKEYLKLFDAYNVYFVTFVVALMSICNVLLLPFVQLYTRGADIDYSMKWLPLLFCSVQVLSSIRAVSNNLITVAGHFRQTVSRTITEAVINVSASLILVNCLGIYGVLLGTCGALLYRSNDIIIYANKKLLNRSPRKTYWPITVNIALFASSALISSYINFTVESPGQMVVVGVLTTLVILPVYLVVVSVTSPQEFHYVWSLVLRRLLKPKTTDE